MPTGCLVGLARAVLSGGEAGGFFIAIGGAFHGAPALLAFYHLYWVSLWMRN